MAITNDTLLWADRKRYFGLPISFTRYSVSEDRLFVESGLFNRKYEEILLHRIKDITMTRTLGQMIFGVGTISIISSDKTSGKLDIVNIKIPMKVKELIHDLVQDELDRRRYRYGEFDSVNDALEDNL